MEKIKFKRLIYFKKTIPCVLSGNTALRSSCPISLKPVKIRNMIMRVLTSRNNFLQEKALLFSSGLGNMFSAEAVHVA